MTILWTILILLRVVLAGLVLKLLQRLLVGPGDNGCLAMKLFLGKAFHGHP